MDIETTIGRLKEKYSHQPHFIQAVDELLESVIPYLAEQGATEDDWRRLERMLEPERTISFKVVWENDKGNFLVNTGYRVQFNSALGPYKGGLRFDPSVSEDVLKFLAFEQIFKNSLTGLPLGGGKGGSDFNPKGKSDSEIRRFSIAFMTELSKHIGSNTDIPAGDIGVGGREIGYMYGAYKRISNRTDGVLTGKGVSYNGSLVRTEATGFGVVYFVQQALSHIGKELKDHTVAISGSGNVALHTAEKCIMEGARVLTLSDRGGYLYCEQGFGAETVTLIRQHKATGGALSELEIPAEAEYRPGSLWQAVAADMYIPCATQNELSEKDARAIADRGALMVAEGANMPLTAEAIEVVQKAGIIFLPAKAVNAGGVAVSGLEMSQNAGHRPWSWSEVEGALMEIMKHIHETCVEYGTQPDGSVDYVKGANIGGFIRVFKSMKELGW